MMIPLVGYRGFLKWWYPTTIGFPTKNDHFGVWNGGSAILGNTHMLIPWDVLALRLWKPLDLLNSWRFTLHHGESPWVNSPAFGETTEKSQGQPPFGCIRPMYNWHIFHITWLFGISEPSTVCFTFSKHQTIKQIPSLRFKVIAFTYSSTLEQKPDFRTEPTKKRRSDIG